MEDEKIRYVFKYKSLGKGISGEVLLAYDLENDIDVAAKHIPKNLINDEKEMELFTNEVLISTLCENENLAKVHDISDIEGVSMGDEVTLIGEKILNISRNYDLKSFLIELL